MARIHHHILVHLVLLVTRNDSLLSNRERRQINAFILKWHRREKHRLASVSMEEDHLHVLAKVRPAVPLKLYVRRMKTSLARWINRRRTRDRRFLWEHDWWAFSLSHSQGERERTVINTQRHVHRRRSVESEIAILIRRNGGTD